MGTRKWSIPAGKNKCRGPETGTCLLCLRNSRESRIMHAVTKENDNYLGQRHTRGLSLKAMTKNNFQ